MKANLIKMALTKVIGKTIMYNTYNYKIIGFMLVDEKVVVATDTKDIIFPQEEAAQYINEFLPVEDEKMQEKQALQIMPDKKQVADLKGIILQNIKNVQKDKAYVPQANAINKSINTMISMANLELAYYKTMKK
jgi:hypothetical protein